MKQITVAIAGLGGRGKDTYAKIQHKFPERMKIVAIADKIPEKLEEVKKEYGIPDDRCFSSAEEMLMEPRLADVMFICTMDRDHYREAVTAMEKGYDILLEKPISPNLTECLDIARIAERLKRKVVVCHVLRYTPFYATLKEKLDSGVIGDTVCIQATEQVGYWHQCHSFVRGNWRNSDMTSPMILQKSCHDMDILVWLTNSKCESLSSVGGLKEFKAEMAPVGAAERCTDCALSDTCPFSAVRYYGTQLKKGNNGWPVNIVLPNATYETMMEELKTSPYGRCVYHSDNNVVDHQSVLMTMKNGIKVNFTMTAFNNGGREIKIYGTRGTITGNMDAGTLRISVFDGVGGTLDEDINVYELFDDFSGHGGGDVRLVLDFLSVVAGERKFDGALTTIDKSVESHVMALAAEKSRLSGGERISMEEMYLIRT